MPVDRSKDEDALDLDQIQGDVLVGLQKYFEAFVGFHIAEVPTFKAALKKLAPEITTARTAYERELTLRLKKEAKSEVRFNFIGVNIGFTFSGLTVLGLPNLNSIKDTAFKLGLPARSAALGDPPGAPAGWSMGSSATLHGLVIVTGPDEDTVHDKVAELKLKFGAAWTVQKTEVGKTREAHRGHEHFGYLDGVSQPAIRGKIDHLFPGVKFLHPSLNPDNNGQGLPGADLHWPGEFVFGYPEQDAHDVEGKLPAKDGGLPWMKNGTYMVFRKLNQLVPEFDKTVAAAANTLSMDAGLLGARMVGRWKSGAPVELSPLQDNTPQGGDEMLNNDFEFGEDSAPPRRCPFSAHIRKAYPRNDITPEGIRAAKPKPSEFELRELSEADTQKHRIMRRGIPFGEELSPAEKEQRKTLDPEGRGLMFVCYQTSIEQQFEFILSHWVNEPDFALSGTGEDPILGQHLVGGVGGGAGARTRNFVGATVNYPGGPLGPATALPTDFIVATAGAYVFVPSISALQTVLS